MLSAYAQWANTKTKKNTAADGVCSVNPVLPKTRKHLKWATRCSMTRCGIVVHRVKGKRLSDRVVQTSFFDSASLLQHDSSYTLKESLTL